MSEYSNGEPWDNAADEHHELNNLISIIGNRVYGAPEVDKAIGQAQNSLETSVAHHNEGRYREAHKHIKITGEHIERAAQLGSAHTSDPYYGLSMHPASFAESSGIAYKNAYLS